MLDMGSKVTLKSGEPGKFLEAPCIGNEREYCLLEIMANLDKTPRSCGLKVAAFPVKIEKVSIGWTRAVVIRED
jgi:hypothetical protein